MKHNYQLLCCTIALSICAGQVFAQQSFLNLPNSGLQAYHPIKKWRGLDIRSVIMRPEFITGLANTATGQDALINIDKNAVANTADGYVALGACTECEANTAVGAWTLYSLISGNGNTAIGSNVLYFNNGTQNTGVGAYTLYQSTGSYNTAVGADALQSAVGESNSVAIGYNALSVSNSSNGYNTATGTNAMSANTTGFDNTAYGSYALSDNTQGYYNVANGYLAMYQNTSGNYNLADGLYSMYNNTTASDNTGVGSFATVGPGAVSNSTALGYGAYASSSNQVILGNSSVTSIGGYANWTNFSDGRYKKNIQQNVPGLAFINKLTPITYTLDIDGIETKLHQNDKAPSIKGLPSKPSYLNDPVVKQAMQEKAAITYTGFVAQDVEKAADSVGFTFSGIDKPKDVDQSFYGLRYGDFVVPLVKAVQELSASSNSKDSAINALQGKYDSLQTQVNELRAMLLAKNSSAMSGASLDQNAPNPFTGSTVIGYSLPKGVSSAQMQITDVSGNVLALIPLSGVVGKSTLTASLSGQAAGIYMYSLIVNGKLVSTRQMIAVR
jgi:trimeric autotransporter adhesin